MTTYVAFDGDKDIWAYRFLRGWSANNRIDFELLDAHDLDNMTARAQDEYYVKEKLRERMNKSKAFVLLVGESTKHLHKYVGWEIDLAVEIGLPIIVVNLNDKTAMDVDRCPAKVRDLCAVHIPFKLAAIRHALDNWPTQFRKLDAAEKGKGWRHNPDLATQWLARRGREDEMSALYIMRHIGGTGAGFGAIYIGKGTIVGVDVQNGRYHGTYIEQGDRVRPTVTLSLPQGGVLVTGSQVPPGTKITMTADWPANFANGQAQQIMVQGSPVQVTFEKIGDVP